MSLATRTLRTLPELHLPTSGPDHIGNERKELPGKNNSDFEGALHYENFVHARSSRPSAPANVKARMSELTTLA